MPEVMSIEVDEEFDPRPPAQPFGMRGPDGNLNIGLIAGIAVAVILVIALIFLIANPFSSDNAKAKIVSWNPKNPLSNAKSIPAYPIDSAIVNDLQASLNAWAEFAASGDIKVTEQTFDTAGRQYALLLNGSPATDTKEKVKSAAELKAEFAALPVPNVPAKVEIVRVGNAGKQGNIYTLRTDLIWTEPGKESVNFTWDIKMKKGLDSVYLLYTVGTTEPEALKAMSFCEIAKVVSNLDDDAKVLEEIGKLTGSIQFDKYLEVISIRKKVWQRFEEIVAGNEDEAAVKVIADSYVTLESDLKEQKSISSATENVEDISDSYESLDASVQEECGKIDVTNR